MLYFILGFIIFIIISVIIFRIISYFQNLHFMAQHFEYMMEIHYEGKIKDIKSNLTMFYSFLRYAKEYYDFSDVEKNVKIDFVPKELSKYELGKKFWAIKKEEKFDKFIKKYYDVNIIVEK